MKVGNGMKFTKVNELDSFMQAVNKCKGNVYLKSAEGDCFNLKSTFSCYIGIGRLLSEHGDELELFCDEAADETLFYKFFTTFPSTL